MISRKKEQTGVVVSDRMNKTAVVLVSRRVKDQWVQKYYDKRKKFKAHDEKNECKTGDRVLIRECPPISREKRWVVAKILEKGESLK